MSRIANAIQERIEKVAEETGYSSEFLSLLIFEESDNSDIKETMKEVFDVAYEHDFDEELWRDKQVVSQD